MTSLVHMENGKIYDPLIGQWMSPLWENVLERVATPTHLHLYRLNGNDPINTKHIKEPPMGKCYCEIMLIIYMVFTFANWSTFLSYFRLKIS